MSAASLTDSTPVCQFCGEPGPVFSCPVCDKQTTCRECKDWVPDAFYCGAHRGACRVCGESPTHKCPVCDVLTTCDGCFDEADNAFYCSYHREFHTKDDLDEPSCEACGSRWPKHPCAFWNDLEDGTVERCDEPSTCSECYVRHGETEYCCNHAWLRDG
jgi:hypothetical protein